MMDLLRRFARRIVKAEEESLRNSRAVARLLSGVNAGSVLDLGCGDGVKTEAYARMLAAPPARITGVESQARYAAEAVKKFEVWRIDMEREAFPAPDETFDLVICNQVLEHLKNIYLPLNEMDRVVKTGGSLLIGVPNLAGFYNRFLLMLGRQPLAIEIDGPHVRGFAHGAFLRFLEQNPNFEVSAVGSSNLYPFPYPLMELLCGSFAGLSSFTFYLLRKKTHDPRACGWKPGAAGDTVFS